MKTCPGEGVRHLGCGLKVGVKWIRGEFFCNFRLIGLLGSPVLPASLGSLAPPVSHMLEQLQLGNNTPLLGLQDAVRKCNCVRLSFSFLESTTCVQNGLLLLEDRLGGSA